jgi:salicylate hydroxylase
VPATSKIFSAKIRLAASQAGGLGLGRLRRERVTQVQRGARENGLRYDSAYSDLGVRDAEITAHAAFRKRLYDHDVVPDAQAAAAMLVG